MYSTCLFCNAALGANRAVEHFPVGRRLAFDPAKGRLWAVCRKCERWNLTPIEERWEAIEECERSFRETKLRVTTGEIGLGRLKEGLELVRIGKPLRPEFAAWRYGDQFGRRRRKNMVQIGVSLAAGMAWTAFAGGPLVLVGIGAYGLASLTNAFYPKKKVVSLVRDDSGRILPVRLMDAGETLLLPPHPGREWGLQITHLIPAGEGSAWSRFLKESAATELRGESALRAAAQLLPSINREGASKSQVQEAVRLATDETDPMIAFRNATTIVRRSWVNFGEDRRLTSLPTAMRLALEMASHEESERRAMEGDLKQLEDAWREAEEIAGISDNMFLPKEVSDHLAEMKRRGS